MQSSEPLRSDFTGLGVARLLRLWLGATALTLTFANVALAAPARLRVNAASSPIGVGTGTPVFSWMNDAATPNWSQSAFQIQVTMNTRLLPGKPDTWDSGKVLSSDSLNIRYVGAPLRSQQLYTWAVRVWDRAGRPGPWKQSSFETGLLTKDDWKAKWIKRDNTAAASEIAAVRWIWLPGVNAEQVPAGAEAHFLYRLHLDRMPESASLHLLAASDVVARVNGHVSGHHSDWGAFDREEITNLLHVGDNEIELDCTSRKPFKDEQLARSAVAASIHLITGGEERRIVSDASWLAKATPSAAWGQVQVVGPMSLKFSSDVNGRVTEAGPDRVGADVSLFRKTFPLAGKVVSARLSITALGAYKAFLNGKPVAPDTLLAPGWTDFNKRVQFQTYDVTNQLQSGGNTLAAMLGGGWQSSPLSWAGIRLYTGPNLLRAQLDLTLADGTRQTIASDESWSTAASPIDYAEIYGGESFDARLFDPAWAKTQGKTDGWAPASLGAPSSPDLALVAQSDDLIRQTLLLKPQSLTPGSAAHPAVFDMGQNMVGNIRLHVRGERGTVVKMRFSERINPDGTIYTENLRNADATDIYVLSGQGEETYTPAFTFHGFRYVELSGVRAPTLNSIEGLVFNSLPNSTSVRLTSSSETLNKMNELGAWGQRGNFLTIPTDCPQRDERLGWMGDAGVFWRTGTFNFDTQAFSHKFMIDVEDAQTAAGEFTDVSPNILGEMTGAPGWGDAGIFIPYATWLQYGDTAIIEQAWPAMERWMNNIQQNNSNYLRQKNLGNNYGDWLAPDPNTPKDLVATAYWALIAKEMSEMAQSTGKSEDARKYKALYDHIAAAYLAAYVRDDGSVAGNTQTGYLSTLFTGLAPASLQETMIDRLVKDVQAHGYHLTTGFLGTPFLLSVLDQHRRSDVAFKLLLSDTYPSWGYMVKKGATTWWERWNGDTGDPSMNSYNHYAFGSVMAWVYRRAAGIDTDALGSGYKHIVVQPHFDADLPQLHVEYDSAYGTIISDWQQSTRTFTVKTPANTVASILLPDGRKFEVGSGSHQYHVQ